MLFRLSRVSFWLAAAVAAAVLLAPRGRETLLAAVSMACCTTAFALWRAGTSSQRLAHASTAVGPERAALTEPALADVAAALVRAADSAESSEEALHAVARVLRGELGARNVRVFELRSVDAGHAVLSELIESQPGFRPMPQRVRLDGQHLDQVIRTQQPCGTAPGSAAVPLTVAGRVTAVIELTNIELCVEPQALGGLLALACLTLSRQVAALAGGPDKTALFVKPEAPRCVLSRSVPHDAPASGMLEAPDEPGRPQSSLAPGLRPDKPQDQESGTDDHVRQPFRQGSMIAMLNKHSRLFAPADARESVGPVAAAPGPVLDPAALARLTELDPKGENQLLERVLKAFQSSVARLRPQADAARLSGDHAGLRLVAHTLKSSSASIGAMHLSQLCAQVETTIRTGGHDGLGAQLDALSAALDSALAAIDELLEQRA